MDSSFLYIGLGGALGAVARVGLARVVPSFLLTLPLKMLCINILGCFAIGVLTEIMALYWSPSLNMRHFLIQGFLGGFTTFSAFALESGLLYEKGAHWTALIYVLLSVLLSLTFFFFGLRVIRLLAS